MVFFRQERNRSRPVQDGRRGQGGCRGSKKTVKEPDHRFRWFLCKTYQKECDDPWFDNLSPLQRLWYYESWLADIEEKHEFARNYAIFTGSFANMELAQHIVAEDSPDHASTDEDFEESAKVVLAARDKGRRRRRRRVVNG